MRFNPKARIDESQIENRGGGGGFGGGLGGGGMRLPIPSGGGGRIGLGGFLVILGAFPLLLAAVPGLAETRIAGIPFGWLLLGVGIYPVIGLSAWLYTRTAARNEARYRDLAGDQ